MRQTSIVKGINHTCPVLGQGDETIHQGMGHPSSSVSSASLLVLMKTIWMSYNGVAAQLTPPTLCEVGISVVSLGFHHFCACKGWLVRLTPHLHTFVSRLLENQLHSELVDTSRGFPSVWMSLMVWAGFPSLVSLGNHKHICRYKVAHSEAFALGQVPSSPGRRKHVGRC